MKPRYYPHVTILGAVALTVAPLLLVLLLTATRDEFAANELQMAGETWSDVPADASKQLSPTDVLHPDAIVQSKKTAREGVPEAPEQSSGVARLAMTEPRETNRQQVPTYGGPVLTTETRPTVSNAETDTEAVRQMAALPEPESRSADVDMVPIPELPLSPTINAAGNTSSAKQSADQEILPPAHRPQELYADAAAQHDRRSTDTLPYEDHAGELPGEAPVPSAFEVTGHLAMAGGTSTGMGGVPHRPADSVPPPTERTGPVASPNSEHVPAWKLKRNRRGSEKQNGDRPESPDLSSDPRMTEAAAFAPGFGSEPVAVIEDVILQHPLENRRVARVENLVAVTRAPGWPVALVRSDLPDDHWWVQQMVGIRGNAFAARVNFGNETSIAGSVYHLVIVFLDSPDEVRRFRIAKQFKELPEGVRRTREFTFVRR